MQILFKSLIKCSVGVLAIALMTGCGASSKSRMGSTSSSSTANTTPGMPASTGAECNFFDSKDTRLQGRVTTYYYNGVIQDDRVRVKVTGLSDRFSQVSSAYLQFYRWKTDASGNAVLDQTPVQFELEAGNPSRPISGLLTSINLTDVNTFRSAAGIPGSTAQDFFNNVVLVVRGVDFNWSVLKVVLYEGTTALGQADVLLPIYTANPNTYAQYHANILNQLHPFWSQRTQSLSDSEWSVRARSYCF